MDEWFESIKKYLTDVEISDSSVSGSARGLPGVEVNSVQPPPGVRLSIRDIGSASGLTHYKVVAHPGRVPELLELISDSALRTLQFDSADDVTFRQITVRGPSRSLIRLQVSVVPGESGQLPDNLRLIDGLYAVKPLHAPSHLVLEDASLVADANGHFETVEVKGRCGVPDGVTVAHLRVHPEANLRSPEGFVAKDLASTDERLNFTVRGTFSSPPAEGAFITLEDNAVLLVREGITLAKARVEGSGSVVVKGTLRDSEIADGGDAGTWINLEVHGSAEGISGDVSLAAHDGGVLIGGEASPVRVRAIRELRKAEIENISLYQLEGLSNLSELEKLARLSLWMPTKAKEERSLAREMTLAGGSTSTIRHKRAHFWASMADILKKTHATGRVQSAARYNAMHFRRNHLRWGSEKVLLWMYSLVGYGERILRPLIGIGVLCAVVTPQLVQPPIEIFGKCCPRFEEYGETYVALLLSPLAFFKSPIEPPADVFGPVETTLLVGFQVLSLLLLFFALSAIRRITKAE